MTTFTINGVERQLDINDPQLPTWVSDNAFTSGGYFYDTRLKRAEYEAQLAALHLELVKFQAHQANSGQRVMIIFEGRDAAGKGGTINAFRRFLNPRHARTVALTKPTETELGQWYYQRYIS
ncbi:MAG: polyphosphate kinase 2, partial [Rhizobiaceae bacterium]